MIELAEDVDISLIDGFLAALKPDPLMTVSQWADARRILPETSAEPGRFKTDRTPYLREIMDRLSVTDPAQKVVVEKGSQLGFTEAGNNWVGYAIDIAPAPFIFIMPTDAMMKKTSKQRIEKMIAASPELRSKVATSRSKDSGNTLLYKEFPGGFLTMVGANSPVGLSSTPAKNIYGDEIDRYPVNVGEEGAAVDLAETRTATFGARRKIFLTSTPTVAGVSQIHAEFEKTGQRYYQVPCPYCSLYQILRFEQLRYVPGKYRETRYECEGCKEPIEEYHKTQMLALGKWVAKHPDREDGYIYGYHISAMYSPYGFYSWAQMAKEYEDSANNIPKRITFINTKLGECYEAQKGEKPDYENLYNRAEDYELNSPFASVALITAGVDVQADRLEVEIVGWMPGKTSQSLDYIQIVGRTDQDEVWTELEKIMKRTWQRQGDNAIMPLKLMAIDTGYNTQKVYEFIQKHGISSVIPVKGDDKLGQYFSAPRAVDVTKGGKAVGKVKVYRVGVSMLKRETYGFLRLSIDHETGEVPHGYCHIPKREMSYFRGLTAEEEMMVLNKRGFEEYAFVKKYKRNEPLDCRVYARAAAAVIGIDRWTSERWNSELYSYEPEPVTPPPTPNDVTPKRKNDFWNNIDDRLSNF